MIKRLSAPFIRHILACHLQQQVCARAAAHEPGLSRTGFYKLYGQYSLACARGQVETRSPGLSGGYHYPDWPPEVTALLTKLRSSEPPFSYSTAASELFRRLHFPTDRASVRRWALENDLAPDTRYKPQPKPIVLLHCPVF